MRSRHLASHKPVKVVCIQFAPIPLRHLNIPHQTQIHHLQIPPICQADLLHSAAPHRPTLRRQAHLWPMNTSLLSPTQNNRCHNSVPTRIRILPPRNLRVLGKGRDLSHGCRHLFARKFTNPHRQIHHNPRFRSRIRRGNQKTNRRHPASQCQQSGHPYPGPFSLPLAHSFFPFPIP